MIDRTLGSAKLSLVRAPCPMATRLLGTKLLVAPCSLGGYRFKKTEQAPYIYAMYTNQRGSEGNLLFGDG
jgi:hypothetical protein